MASTYKILFQGSVYVRYFSKFTKDIFASLVSLLFIISALKKLHKVNLKTFYMEHGYIMFTDFTIC